jgi:hypothetical protein
VVKGDVVGDKRVAGLVVGELEMLASELCEAVEVRRDDGAGVMK